MKVVLVDWILHQHAELLMKLLKMKQKKKKKKNIECTRYVERMQQHSCAHSPVAEADERETEELDGLQCI